MTSIADRRTLVAVTGVLRSLFVFRAAPTEAVGKYWLNRVPHAWMTVSVLADIATAAGMEPKSYQSLMRLAKDHLALIELLSHVTETVAMWPLHDVELWCDGSIDQRRYIGIIRNLSANQQESRPSSLGEILLKHLPDEYGARVDLLKAIAPRLSQRLVPLREALRHRKQIGIRRRFRNYLFDALPLEVLVTVGSKQHAPANP